MAELNLDRLGRLIADSGGCYFLMPAVQAAMLAAGASEQQVADIEYVLEHLPEMAAALGSASELAGCVDELEACVKDREAVNAPCHGQPMMAVFKARTAYRATVRAGRSLAVDAERCYGPGEYTLGEMRAWLASPTSVIHGTDMAAALLAVLAIAAGEGSGG